MLYMLIVLVRSYHKRYENYVQRDIFMEGLYWHIDGGLTQVTKNHSFIHFTMNLILIKLDWSTSQRMNIIEHEV